MSKNQIELRLSKNLRSLIKERGMTVVALSRKTATHFIHCMGGWLELNPEESDKLSLWPDISALAWMNFDSKK
jgi:hypothetical protein